MRTLRRLLAVRPDGRRVLVAAMLLVVAAGLSLRLCPYRVVRRLAARLARPTARRRAPAAVIALAVAAAGRRVPGGRNCLAQALAAHVLPAVTATPAGCGWADRKSTPPKSRHT